jgi:hypothetical protein
LAKTKIIEVSELDPWKLFLNAMRSPSTKDRYQTRVAKFFDFIRVPGKTLEQKARIFAKKGKNDTNWAISNILKFIYFQKERVDKKEISGATVINYTDKFRETQENEEGVKVGIVAANNHYAGFGAATANMFRVMSGLNAVE